MPPLPQDDTGSLELAKKRLYDPSASFDISRRPLPEVEKSSIPHAWDEREFLGKSVPLMGARHVRLAGVFFGAAVVFFLAALAIAGYFFYFGGNTVSVDKISVDIQGPTTIAGGDTVPLAITVTNHNPVAVQNATIEIDFPDGTRSADNVMTAYPRYVENLGTLESGATVTRSIKAVIFGGQGQAVSLPVSLSYGTSASNAIFVKKSSYGFSVSSTPLSISVDTLSQTVSGKPLTLTFTVRSNATVPLSNVVVQSALPFGFSLTSSSIPQINSDFSLGTLAPGASKTVTLTGTLVGQDAEQRVFHFTVGTAKSADDPTLAVSYMTQDTSVTIAAPFISTTLALNGDTSGNATISAGGLQTVTISYTNTLPTNVANTSVSVTVSGSMVDYNTINSSTGFYRSSDHTVVFSQDTDPALANLAPGASGLGTFTFSTLAPGSAGASPTVTFTISVAGTRVGQTNVPEDVTASAVKTFKVVTAVALTASAMHALGPFANTGPVPPRANTPTSYSIAFNLKDEGSAVAGGSVTTVLPSYVSYTNNTSGDGSFSYDSASHSVSWNAGDLGQGGSAQGAFQVSLTPSTSQKGTAPQLTGPVSFSGYDRFAGVQVSATANPVTTETPGDPGYSPNNANVQ